MFSKPYPLKTFHGWNCPKSADSPFCFFLVEFLIAVRIGVFEQTKVAIDSCLIIIIISVYR